jgi:ribonuclease P protein component
MLTASHRLRNSADFTSTTRSGFRAAKNHLVAHFHLPSGGTGPAKVGFTVSSSVGGSVVRHRVTRQLRAGCQGLLADLPAGSRLVVRALPTAGQVSKPVLQAELKGVIHAVLAKSEAKRVVP